MKRKLTVGILAHVDAGKTTLSEALLYISGRIRTLGRVDHKNTYLDTNAIERERGITIFSKQARFSTENCDFILLDTPGHVDFSAEAERTLSLLDYAILVISAPDGIQNHTRTLWQLLEYYSVPTFIFVNKTDICIKLKEEIMLELERSLSSRCVAFHEACDKHELDEKIAMADEELLDRHLEGTPIDDGDIAELVTERKLFPCFFGSALRLSAIDFLLEGLDRYTLEPICEKEGFGAKVYKIARSGSARLTYMKITSGKLTARDELIYLTLDGRRVTEKVGQLRLYSGEKFEQVDRVEAGEICAVIGLSATYVGQGLGIEGDTGKPVLEPVLSYRINLPPECDPIKYFPMLKELEEEDPSLHLIRNDELRQIEARLMGDIQIDLLKRLIWERFEINCDFDSGCILYKEKVKLRTVGVGHFEPLRHYAEVHLLLEPQPKGTGLIFDVRVSDNDLDPNRQRFVLSHLYEKMHRGVLIGAQLTDTKITLIAGRAHVKHTEGGDFREATYRAVRQGLMKAGCILLEPYYKFRLELPSTYVGRAMSDLQARDAEFEIEASGESYSVIVGRAPVSELHDYPRELISYTRGQGILSCTFDGYEPCHNAEEIIAASGYDPEADLENTPHSVFCDHGAGFVVPWNKVDEYKHVNTDIALPAPEEAMIPKVSTISKKYSLSEDELEAIMLREFGPIKRRVYGEPKVVAKIDADEPPRKKKKRPHKHLTIVDGYNVIHAWESLSEIAAFSLEKARESLMHILSNYVAFTKCSLILVFDAYLVKDGAGSDFIHDGYRVVYTKEDQTADAFIEKIMHDFGPDYEIRVVSGDKLIQFSAVFSGIPRMTAKEFEEEVTAVGNEITEFVRKLAETNKRKESKQ